MKRPLLISFLVFAMHLSYGQIRYTPQYVPREYVRQNDLELIEAVLKQRQETYDHNRRGLIQFQSKILDMKLESTDRGYISILDKYYDQLELMKDQDLSLLGNKIDDMYLTMKKDLVNYKSNQSGNIKSESPQDTNISSPLSCEALINYVKQNGENFQSYDGMRLISSTWLREAKAYKIREQIVVIAKIKLDETSLQYKEYIFCELPISNWNSFYDPLTDLGMSHGEKFHKYIFQYKCNCN